MRRSLFENLNAYGGHVWLVTITAPGDDVLPRVWIDAHSGEIHAAGDANPFERPLVVEARAAHEWNRTAGKRWSELHRRSQQATRRSLGDGSMVLAYAWQMQARGVLHVHLVLAFETAAERAVAWRYVQELRGRTREHLFGYIDARDRDGKRGRSMVMEPHRAAGYVSRYLGESSQLVQAIASTARPTRVVYIARRLTSETNCTMRRLRRVRFLYWIRKGESRVIAQAGRLPDWFRDRIELAAVQSLLRESIVVAAP